MTLLRGLTLFIFGLSLAAAPVTRAEVQEPFSISAAEHRPADEACGADLDGCADPAGEGQQAQVDDFETLRPAVGGLPASGGFSKLHDHQPARSLWLARSLKKPPRLIP